jgi:glycine hydroxymethyltransferase
MLVDVSSAGLTGDQAEKVIELADLTCNKNPMPGDPVSSMKWRGVRLGVSAVTTRGMKVAEMKIIGRLLSRIWSSTRGYEVDEDVIIETKSEVATLCHDFPSYR